MKTLVKLTLILLLSAFFGAFFSESSSAQSAASKNRQYNNLQGRLENLIESEQDIFNRIYQHSQSGRQQTPRTQRKLEAAIHKWFAMQKKIRAVKKKISDLEKEAEWRKKNRGKRYVPPKSPEETEEEKKWKRKFDEEADKEKLIGLFPWLEGNRALDRYGLTPADKKKLEEDKKKLEEDKKKAEKNLKKMTEEELKKENKVKEEEKKQLIKERKKLSTEGKDTSKLDKKINDLNVKIKEGKELLLNKQINNIEKGHFTDKEKNNVKEYQKTRNQLDTFKNTLNKEQNKPLTSEKNIKKGAERVKTKETKKDPITVFDIRNKNKSKRQQKSNQFQETNTLKKDKPPVKTIKQRSGEGAIPKAPR